MRTVITCLAFCLNIFSIVAQTNSVGWKLYTNTQYSFCIKYPDYCYEIDTSGPISMKNRELYKAHHGLSFYFDKKLFSVDFGNESVPIISVTVFNNSEKFDLKAFSFKVIDTNPGDYKIEELTFENYFCDNFKGLKVIYQNKAGGYDGINKDVFIEKGNYVFNLRIVNPPDGDYDVLFDKLMKSFKLLN